MTGIDPLGYGRGKEILGKAQVNIPFPMLFENLEAILEVGLQPEIFFSGVILDQLRWMEQGLINNIMVMSNILPACPLRNQGGRLARSRIPPILPALNSLPFGPR